MKIIAINYYTILATEKVSGGIFVATIIPNFGPQIESKIVLSGIMERFPVESEIEMCATLQPNPESPANKDASENRRLSPRSAWRGGPEVWVVGASSHSVTITTPEEVVSEVRDLLGNGYRTITIERQGSPENLSTSGRALKSAPVASGAGRGVCGCGKAAEWTDADQSPVMQAICSVAESEEECRTIEVEPVDLPNTEATQTQNAPTETAALRMKIAHKKDINRAEIFYRRCEELEGNNNTLAKTLRKCMKWISTVPRDKGAPHETNRNEVWTEARDLLLHYPEASD